jgi:5-methylcytosine-specific restriction endonuclease McrA
MDFADDGSFTLDVKAAILARDNGRCDRCGFKVTSGHFHHRHPREMGGTRRAWIGLPSNGLLLHPACHDWVESHRTVALELGMLVRSGQRPAQVPVYRWNGWRAL